MSLHEDLVRLAHRVPKFRGLIVPTLRSAGKWNSLPKGWTEESVKKFWDSTVGDVKHPVTKCIKKMEDKMDDPGAFCSSLKDKVDGPGWRHEPRKARLAARWLRRVASQDRYVEILETVGKAFRKSFGFTFELDLSEVPDVYHISIWDPSDEPAYAPTLSIMLEPDFGYMIGAGRHSTSYRRPPNYRKLIQQAMAEAKRAGMI